MNDNLCMLFTIVNYSDEKRLLSIINKYKIGFKYVMHGRGTASSSVLDYFGLNDEGKSIITMILPNTISKKLLKEIELKINVNDHGKGICFSIPLSSSTKYMVDFYKNREVEDIEMEDAYQHLIVTIVNQGYSEKVMMEAKKGGATGGTTLSGRGLANEKTIKFLNLAIEPEKDIVLILVPTEKKNKIMDIILKNCGLKTPGAGICFSLPVDHVVGLNNHINN